MGPSALFIHCIPLTPKELCLLRLCALCVLCVSNSYAAWPKFTVASSLAGETWLARWAFTK